VKNGREGGVTARIDCGVLRPFIAVLTVRDDDADQPPVLVVEDVAERASSVEL
jgi:hypothetical protein